MAKINLGRKKLLDGETLFRYYFTEMGEARSIRRLAAYQKEINPATGRKVTPSAPWWSMWRWAMEHSKEAYEIFQKAMYNEGKYHTEDEFEEFLQGKAWTLLKHDTKDFDKWLKQHGKKKMINV